MNRIAVSTFPLLWWFAEARYLSPTAVQSMETADRIIVNAATLLEIEPYLTPLVGAPEMPLLLDEIEAEPRFRVTALNIEQVRFASTLDIPATILGADRIAIVTAVYNGCGLVTDNPDVQQYLNGDPGLLDAIW